MTEELKLSMKELYFMGKFMKGKYIDYSYLARMEDIEKNYAVYKQDTKTSLIRKGVLWEDFSGNMETEPIYLRLLHPVFFGETETAVCMARIIDGREYTTSCRWHFEPEQGVLCEETEEGICICLATKEKTVRMLRSLFPAVAEPAVHGRLRTLQSIHADQVVSLKAVSVGQESRVYRYLQENGRLYELRDDSSLLPLGKEQFLQKAMRIIWRG